MRCISAWAEEPLHGHDASKTWTVHLRVGGGTATPAVKIARVCGASPRGRRNPRPPRLRASLRRCISAWAEEPVDGSYRADCGAVHLRVGGGTTSEGSAGQQESGASPRGRRNLRDMFNRDIKPRCISAWAEEPSSSRGRRRFMRVHLRVGGGTRGCHHGAGAGRGASPRGRRNLAAVDGADDTVRCISAWAEEPAARGDTVHGIAVHLRVGGGTRDRDVRRGRRVGASPRGRRNPRLLGSRRVSPGCISAWAEEPGVTAT